MEIREVEPRDAVAFQQLRMGALKSDPDAFIETVTEMRRKPISEIERMLARNTQSADRMLLGAFTPNLVAMMGLTRQARIKLRHKSTIWGVYVHPDMRGQKIGGQLLDELIRRASRLHGLRQLQLTVVADNQPAIALYQSRGFTQFGHEREAVISGDGFVDEIYMVKWLHENE